MIRTYRYAALAAVLAALAACDSVQGNVTLGVVGATIAGGLSPTHEVEQVYYLGAFDPQGQLPPSVYRIRVRGQASFISQVKFASGWVHASLIDSLGTGFKFDDNGRVEVTKTDDQQLAAIQTGRRLVQFGPEGFREAPKDHRLVVVMGTSPEKFFQAIDQTLGSVSEALSDQRNAALTQKLFEALVRIKAQRERLADLDKDIALQYEK